MSPSSLSNLIELLYDKTPEIERESYKVILEKVDLNSFEPVQAYLILRAIHATARIEYKDELIFSEHGIRCAINAMKDNQPVISDTKMLKAAIAYPNTICFLNTFKNRTNLTQTAYAINKALEAYPKKAIFAIGSAPTALNEIINKSDNPLFQPALVIGVPVGFIGALEAKLKLMSTSLNYITNDSLYGGASLAAALINGLYRLRDINL